MLQETIIEISKFIFKHQLSSTDLAILFYLSSCDQQIDCIQIRHADIADEYSIHPDIVNTSIRRLIKSGLLIDKTTVAEKKKEYRFYSLNKVQSINVIQTNNSEILCFILSGHKENNSNLRQKTVSK